MDDTAVGEDGATLRSGAEVGARLRAAREALGLSLADVVQRTRVPLRHLEAIERGDYEELPSRTYAVGFARAYARAVRADEVAIAGDVRAALARVPRVRDYEPYEISDPARVPSRGLVILAAGGALALMILVALWFGTDLFRRGGRSQAATPSATAGAAASGPATVAVPAPAPAAGGGQVRLTASDDVWLRVYDADGKTLFLGTMKPGDHFDVPPGARDPQINVGRPDKLTVTLNGATVAPLGDGSHAIKDVKVSGAALAARTAGTPAPAGAASPSPTPSPTASRAASARPSRDRSAPRATPTPSDTQRANLDAAAAPPAAVGNGTP